MIKTLITIIIMIISIVTYAGNCTKNLHLKFGTLVKIKSSSYSNWAEESFVKNLSGVVVNKYSVSSKSCKPLNIVYAINVCDKYKNCKKFSLCYTDIEVLEDK